jgi:hypothetical protein
MSRLGRSVSGRRITEGMEDMSNTFAPQAALVAASARPCLGLVHGYQWRAAASSDMTSNFMNETAIKRPARRLGKQPT